MIENLLPDAQYHFVVRAFVGEYDSADSDELDVNFASDNGDTGEPDTTPNEKPLAEAGANMTVASGETVILDGSSSIDPDGDTLTYSWTQTSGPTAGLSTVDPAQVSFTAPDTGSEQSITLIFELTVTDSGALSSTDTCVIQVLPKTPSDTTDSPTGDDNDGNDTPTTDANQSPAQPAIISPSDGAASVSLRLKLRASDFDDPDAGDYHKTSEWKIVSVEDQNVAFQVERRYRLTSLRVPLFVLSNNTTYTCQVRYFDQNGKGSPWSSPVTFTTRAGFSVRVDDTVSVPGFDGDTDINTNGIPDLEETDVVRSFVSTNGLYAVTVAIEEDGNGAELEDAGAVTTEDEASTPPDAFVLHDIGLIGYRVRVPQPGDDAAVQIRFSIPVEAQTRWVMFDADGEWLDDTAMVYEQPDDHSFVRLLTDGGPGDADGVANGVIVDLIAPLSSDSQDSTYLDSDGANSESSTPGGSSCFMDTLLN